LYRKRGASSATVAVVTLTTLHLHRVDPAGVPAALLRMGLDRRHLARTSGLRFWKLLGTGDGRTFDVRDADPRTWGLLGVWEDADALAAFERRSPTAAAWRRLAVESWRADLRPLAAHGRWSGREPFEIEGPTGHRGQVAAITRARLAPARMRRFWAAVPPVTADLHTHAGLRLAVGIGEAPVGLQGTFSVWESTEALFGFAYRSTAHREVIAETARQGWYAEELFARFAVLQTTGTVRGEAI
jgi:heme-degrading monooxygenase HmoA